MFWVLKYSTSHVWPRPTHKNVNIDYMLIRIIVSPFPYNRDLDNSDEIRSVILHFPCFDLSTESVGYRVIFLLLSC